MSFSIPGSRHFLKLDQVGTSGYTPPVWHLMPPRFDDEVYNERGIRPIIWKYGHVMGQKDDAIYVDSHRVRGDIILMRTCFICVSDSVATVNDYFTGGFITSFACGLFKSFIVEDDFCCFWYEGRLWAFDTVTYNVIKYSQQITTMYLEIDFTYIDKKYIEHMQIYKNYLFIYSKVKDLKIDMGSQFYGSSLKPMQCVAENCYVFEISGARKKKTLC